ncbi:acetyltransferase [Dyadobacter fermentans]|uniref:Hexapeptide repeat-containing protein acetyltransferase n=1 Tax=Dyadobacter fermentans (strain ATCC 700827 / DSM 18053 / CIP 107007 / KCTC 52180 / NS114) TaxID=471854 RepID=C6VV12_DYAFD|nr:acetyltransferase [Dyadobacter fermentans]ACT94835.1 hexapeptide repeat-containing protein acetyltransferase [Dyadobacter fermentans DSM 18053]
MLIFGAGGHAKVVWSILSACGTPVNGLFDDHWQYVDLHSLQLPRAYDHAWRSEDELIIAIGDNSIRRRIAERVSHSFGKAIHPTAIVDATVLIGPGGVVVQRAVIQADCRLGEHVIVNTGAIVDHECVLGDFVHIGPGATLCGGVHVGAGTLAGAGCVVAPGVNVGKGCVIGAGAVVIRDLPDFAKLAGNPAKVIS